MLNQLQILIKPASDACNIDCRYCFYKEESGQRETGNRGQMDRETSHVLIDQALRSARSCLFGFQGGEPALAGLEYYQDFVDYVNARKGKDQEVLYTIQTNGTLLDEAWMQFLRKYRFLVGLSLDGVRKSHDENRKDYQGNGTFSKVFETAQRLKAYQIPFQVLCVLNGQTAPRIEAIYRFFMRKGMSAQQYIPCLEMEEAAEGEADYSLAPEEMGRAMKRLFDLWFEDKRRGVPVYIRQFDNYVGMLRGGEPEACSMYGRCSVQNVIEADGTVYPCDFYAVDPCEMGNIRDPGFGFETLDQNVEGNPFFEEMSRRDDRCPSCRWYPLCRGGCKKDCQMRSGSQVNRYCEAYQDFFRYAIERLEYLAASGA